jgi:mRNA-degrading endonuclease RelE of RelBE toxin-antitoxin system
MRQIEYMDTFEKIKKYLKKQIPKLNDENLNELCNNVLKKRQKDKQEREFFKKGDLVKIQNANKRALIMSDMKFSLIVSKRKNVYTIPYWNVLDENGVWCALINEIKIE